MSPCLHNSTINVTPFHVDKGAVVPTPRHISLQIVQQFPLLLSHTEHYVHSLHHVVAVSLHLPSIGIPAAGARMEYPLWEAASARQGRGSLHTCMNFALNALRGRGGVFPFFLLFFPSSAQ